MLTICTWLWGNKYGRDDVAKLAAGVRRHLSEPHRFVVISDRDVEIESVESYAIPDQDRALLDVPGCFCRLRMFDPVWQKLMQVHGRLVCMDLDSIVTGPLDPLFLRAENFLILQGANAKNPCPYNGSLWMLRAGYAAEVWSHFSLDAAASVPYSEFPDDQAWMAHKLPGAAGWLAGPRSGVYAFQKPGWPDGTDLPKDARLVAFPGWRSPEKFKDLPWVREHWRQ